MVFKRKINDYWILEHTIRKGKKFVKKTKYIGKTLPPEKRLAQLKKEFLREIFGQKYKYLTEKELEKIEERKEEYKSQQKKLSETEKKKKLEEFIVRFTYDSSKLAGVDITLRQTSLILKEGLMPKSIVSLKTAKEIENHEKGVLAIIKYKGKLNLKFIKKLHKILLSGVNDSVAGKTRAELKRDVRIAGTTYVPPKHNLLNKEIDNFLKWYKEESKKLHPIELAALTHLKLISIQPFVDGNSRTSRLLMNWILWKKNYPMIDIPIEDLEKYYCVLDKYQIEKNEKPFIDYIKEKFLEGC